MLQHIYSIRIYYEDTDLGGVVYHSNYLKFFERARTEMLREHGYELSDLLSRHNMQFVVHSAELEYLRPARLDQLLYIVTKVTEVRSASIRYNQNAYLEAENGILSCRANIRLACLDRDQRPRGLPDILSMEKKL